MIEPQIQYCRTSDGVDVAYWASSGGTGVPIILQSPLVYSHLARELDAPGLREWYARLAEHRPIARFDPRGGGLSHRDVALMPDVAIRDIEAVADRLGWSQFALMGCGGASPATIAFAAVYPERVSRLVLSNGMARLGDLWEHPSLRNVLPLAERDWHLFTETWSHVIYGWDRSADAHDWARYMRDCLTQEVFLQSVSAEMDVGDRLSQVKAATLLLSWSQYPNIASRRLASEIAGARLVLYPRGFFYMDDVATRAIDDFLAEGDAAASGGLSSGTAIILFTDIVDSTPLTESMGDAAFRAASRKTDEAVRATITQAGGTPVHGKVLGDGVMGVFTSAMQAIAAARRCVAASPTLPLHIGIHAGDVISEGDNVYGGAVNIASRICGLCAPGEILVSATVRDLARTSAGVTFEDRGEHNLKGIAEPQRVYAIREGN